MKLGYYAYFAQRFALFISLYVSPLFNAVGASDLIIPRFLPLG
jgi:hypothetical protein